MRQRLLQAGQFLVSHNLPTSPAANVGWALIAFTLQQILNETNAKYGLSHSTGYQPSLLKLLWTALFKPSLA